MIPTFKQYLKDQDERERELRARTDDEVSAGIPNTLNTKPDKVTWCPDL